MSTEQKPPQTPPASTPHHKEHYETTALGTTILSSWDKFKQGKLISYKAMGIILIVATAIGVTIYILSEKSRLIPKQWMELESVNTLSQLQEFATKNPNSMVGRAAEMDRARVLLGPDGIEKLTTSRDEGERKRAIENIEEARSLMLKLIDQLKDEPILKLECLVGMAKSEAALIGVPKEGGAPTDYRGSVEKLLEWLDKVVQAGEGTPWADDAKKLSDALKSGPKTKEELTEVQANLYRSSLGIGGGPLGPGDGPLGPGAPPFGGGFPPIRALPGGSDPIPPIKP